MNNKIISKIEGIKVLPIKELNYLQPEGFKDIAKYQFDSLKNSLKSKDYIDPVKVWYNTKEKKYYVLDGVHRLKAIESLKKDGVDFADRIPCLMVHCDTMQDAVENVLFYSSEYAVMTPKGLGIMLEGYQVNLSEDVIEALDSEIKHLLDDIDTGNIGGEDLGINTDLIPREEPTPFNLHKSAHGGKEYADPSPEGMEMITILGNKDKIEKIRSLLPKVGEMYGEVDNASLLLKILEKEVERGVILKKDVS